MNLILARRSEVLSEGLSWALMKTRVRWRGLRKWRGCRDILGKSRGDIMMILGKRTSGVDELEERDGWRGMG